MYIFYKNAINHGKRETIAKTLERISVCRSLTDADYSALLHLTRVRWYGA